MVVYPLSKTERMLGYVGCFSLHSPLTSAQYHLLARLTAFDGIGNTLCEYLIRNVRTRSFDSTGRPALVITPMFCSSRNVCASFKGSPEPFAILNDDRYASRPNVYRSHPVLDNVLLQITRHTQYIPYTQSACCSATCFEN
jgi:hypothetical protein